MLISKNNDLKILKYYKNYVCSLTIYKSDFKINFSFKLQYFSDSNFQFSQLSFEKFQNAELKTPVGALDNEQEKNKETYFVSPAPVALVLLQHSLPEHRHHFRKLFVREGRLCELLHHRT